MLYFDILEDPRLDRAAKDAYICILRHADYYERSHEGRTRREIARIMSISVDTFDRGVRQLITCGYLEVHKRLKPGTSSYLPSLYVLYDSRAARLERDLARAGGTAADDETTAQDGRTMRPPQTNTTPAPAAPCGHPCRTMRPPLPHDAATLAAPCGSTSKEREEKEERKEKSGHLGEAEHPLRNARARKAPAAKKKPKIHPLASEALAAMPDYYRRAPAWLRSQVMCRVSAAIEEGYGPLAIAAYAHKLAGDPARGDYEHLRHLSDVLRALAADVAEAAACKACGRDPTHPHVCDVQPSEHSGAAP